MRLETKIVLLKHKNVYMSGDRYGVYFSLEFFLECVGKHVVREKVQGTW